MSAVDEQEPLVSVVIPTYQRLPLLLEALESVRAQTYARWEAVVADDGSDDGTAAGITALGDPRIRLVQLAHTGHPGRVRNAGIRAAAGEYVALLDSDDVWLPGKLEAQVAALAGGPARWSYTSYELMDAGGATVPMHAGTAEARSGWLLREILTSHVGVDTSTLMVERALLLQMGGFVEHERLAVRGDLELSLRLAHRSPAAAVARVLARVREHDGRTTRHLSDPFERTARVFDEFLAWCPDPALARIARRRRGAHRAASAGLRLGRGHPLQAVGMFARALAQGATPRDCAREVLRALRPQARPHVDG